MRGIGWELSRATAPLKLTLKEAHLSLLRESSVACGDPELRLAPGARRPEILQRSLCGPANRLHGLPVDPGERLEGKWKLENPRQGEGREGEKSKGQEKNRKYGESERREEILSKKEWGGEHHRKCGPEVTNRNSCLPRPSAGASSPTLTTGRLPTAQPKAAPCTPCSPSDACQVPSLRTPSVCSSVLCAFPGSPCATWAGRADSLAPSPWVCESRAGSVHL